MCSNGNCLISKGYTGLGGMAGLHPNHGDIGGIYSCVLHLRKWKGWSCHSNLTAISGIRSPTVKVPSATGLFVSTGSCLPLQALVLSSDMGDCKMSSFLTAEVARGNPTGNPIPGLLTLIVLPKGGSSLVEKSPYRQERDDSVFKLSPWADRAPHQ